MSNKYDDPPGYYQSQPQMGYGPQPPAAAYHGGGPGPGPYQQPYHQGYGPPPPGAYYQPHPQHGGYYQHQQSQRRSPGCLEGMLAALACCCCLDLLF